MSSEWRDIAREYGLEEMCPIPAGSIQRLCKEIGTLRHVINLEREYNVQIIDQLRKEREYNNKVRDALVWSHAMFEARDIMNAQVHCSPVRLSPITELCKQALAIPRPGNAK